MPEITRRAALGAGVVGAGVLAAACGGGDSDGSPPAGGEATEAPSTVGSAIALIKLADVPVGGCASAKLNGAQIVVSQPSAGVAKAFSAICSHQGCTVNPAGNQFHCPCHGSKYDAFTGAVLKGPAPKALHPIAVTVSGDSVTTV